jgi:hypothetical protein
MRAKLVEVQNFERGIHPKQAIGIGGINLGKSRFDMKKKLRDDWMFFLITILDAKTISAQMNKLTDKGKDSGDNRWGNYTVEVEEWDMEDMDNPAIFIQGKDGEMYALPIDDKMIYIENAS